MVLPLGATEVGPEGDFVLSSNMSGENQLQNPVCVDASLCRLCRFPINGEKEKIIVLTPDDQVSSPFNIYYERCYAPLCIDRSLNISFRHCVYPYCTHNKGLAIAFHAECVEIAAPFGTPLHEYRLVTEHSYRHVSLNHERRGGRIRELIEGALCKIYGKLSPELWHIVSDDDELIRLYTIAELSLQHRKTEWSADPSLPVLITAVRMDGVHQTLTFHGDGLKLRELLTPSIYPQVLWPHPATPSELDSMTFYYAGWGEGDLEARLRTLTFNEPGTTGYSVCWANDEMVSLRVHRNVGHPGTDASLLDEHSEYEDRSFLKWTYYPIQEDEFIQEVWLRGSEKYDTTRPLPSQGEGGLRYHLSTPWGLQKYKRRSDIALALVTSKGRKTVAGGFPDHHGQCTPYSNHRHWDLVARTSANGPLRVFFSPSDHGIPLIVAPRLLDNHTETSPPRQTPLGAMPRFNPLHTLHYSSSSLENVTEVIVCKSENEKDTGVIRHFDLENSRMVESPYQKVAGLLLRYADGSEASVGCFRFDWAETPLTTDGARGLFVGTRPGKIAQIPPHVAAVGITPPEAEGEFTWMEMPWTGVLEWWFNPDSLDTSITHIL
ncbi:hypothetical protein FOC4_g10007902 [Fusarium odoratissimum]|uniref:Uncharacterized protein n=1 Tax=Fusarium oxysporum f. sp. cubense (strain race 4) TaxID=2502994 RepID=N1RJW2_FUSC4|nr:hypothetical protein FOC4_g10007902 [Fusarium odoratissimum]